MDMEQDVNGRAATDEENEEIMNILNSMHVGEVFTVAACVGTRKSNNMAELVLLINSCCGNNAYALDIDGAKALLVGLTNCISVVETGKPFTKEGAH